MNFCLSLALGLGLSFLAQEFLPAVPWAYEARLLLVPVVFFACAVALRFPVMLLFAFATGFVWDARHLVIDSKVSLVAYERAVNAPDDATPLAATREHAAMKLVLYSFAGSALVLAGLLWANAAAVAHGAPSSFALHDLAAAATQFSRGEQIGLFALVFTGFAVLAGMFPFHTWAPTGHVAAPTAASMLLAGVVMKLGAYGCLRVALPLFPVGLVFWQPTIAALALIGILYAGFIALVQDDFKFVIGYSSVSHMGFVLLGLAAANSTAVAGAVAR